MSEMSTHLRIDPLRIKNHGDVRLISSKNDNSANIPILSSASDDDSDNDDIVADLDVNDLEVCVVASNSGNLAGDHAAPEKSVNVLQV